MHFRVLGSVEVVDDHGRAIGVGGTKVRRLLAALLMSPGRAVSLDRLTDAIWYGEQPPEGASTLPSYVTRLRRVLGGMVIEREPAGYALRIASDDVDAGRFEALVGQSRAVAERAVALPTLEEALRLWRGDAYSEFADEAWARGEAGRLEELRAVAAELHVEALLDTEACDAAVVELAQWTTRWPLRERLRALQMIALYRSGRQAEGLRAFQEYRAFIADELGLDPSDELVKLEGRIATGDPAVHLRSTSRHLRGFKLHERIGEGTFGVVYRATQSSIGREVAIKVLRPQYADDPEFIRRFEVEAQLVATLEHPHIVPLYDYWRDASGAYLVMRHVRGGSLAGRITAGPLDCDDVVGWVDQIGAALDVAHRSGIVHCDLKPSNVLVDVHGNAYLTDFGIALGGVGGDAGPGRLEAIRYLAPEQLRHHIAGPATDVYALGLLVYEALTGQSPRAHASSLDELERSVLKDPVPPPRLARPGLPSGVDGVIRGATAKDPVGRYVSAGDVARALRAAVGAEPTVVARLDRASKLQNPYKGLNAFEEADAAVFFGRERLVTATIERLERAPAFVAVIGPSGCGKSSLVRAGVIPRLIGRGDRFVVTVVPGEDPFDEIEAALLSIAVDPPVDLRERLISGGEGFLGAVEALIPDPTAELVLFIDQFEELFTLASDDDRRLLIDSLAAAASSPHGRVRVIVTVRADLLDRPLRHAGIARLINEGQVVVGAMHPDELERAVVGPADRVGLTVAPALVAAVIADMSDQPSALPLLQYALTELVDRHDGDELVVDDYRSLGGISGAIARRAEEIYASCPTDAQAATRRLFGDLVNVDETAGTTRRRIKVADLAREATSQELLDRYAEARLLSFDRDETTREPTLEVAHEAIFTAWPRLRSWLDEDREQLLVRRRLSVAARDWDASGRSPSDLYRGDRLTFADDMVRSDLDRLGDLDREFLDASRAAEAAERAMEAARHRRFRALFAATAIALVVAAALGLVALMQRDRANDARASAEAVAFSAEVRRIGADAVRLAPTDRRLALLLAAEAYRQEPSIEMLGVLQQVLASSTDGFIGYAGTGTPHGSVSWLDDTTFVTATPNRIELWDAGALSLLADTEAVGVLRIASTPDGSWFAAVLDADLDDDGTGGSLLIFDTEHLQPVAIETGSTATSLVALDDEIVARFPDGTAAAWTPTGSLLWHELVRPETTYGDHGIVDIMIARGASMDDETAELWNNLPLATYDVLVPLPSGEIIANSGPMLRYFDPATGQQTRAEHLVTTSTFNGTADPLTPLAMVPTGNGSDVAVLGGDQLTVETINAYTGTVRTVSRHQANASQRIVTLERDGTVFMPDGTARDADDQVLFDTQLSTPTSLARSPGGEMIAAAGAEGVAVFSLTGRQLLADAVPRHDGSFATATAAGDFITVGSQAIGDYSPQASLYRRDAHGGYAEFDYVSLVPDGGFSGGTYIIEAPGRRYLLVGRSRNTGERDVIDLDTGEVLPFVLKMSPVEAMSPDGRWIVAANGFPGLNQLVAYDARTGDVMLDMQLEPGVVSTGSFTRDSDRFTLAYETGELLHWDTDDWSQPLSKEQREDVATLGYSPYADIAATSDLTGVITLRDAATLAPIGPALIGHQGRVEPGFWWGSDGTTLVSSASDGARLWDLDSSVQIGTGFTSPDLVASGSDGRPGVITGNGDFVLSWSLATDLWPQIACAAAGRNMTSEEWEQFGPRRNPSATTCAQWPTVAPPAWGR